MSTILKKFIMALTGLGLAGFLVGHVAGNLLLFAGEKRFNQYAKFMEENPLVIPAEIGLIVIFFLHIYLALRTSSENTAARPEKYGMRQTLGESTFASRTMLLSGLVILFFVIVHVWMFKFGPKHDHTLGGEPRMALYERVVHEFKQPQVALFYVVCMLFLGLHLSHALSSALQTLGALKPRWRVPSRKAGLAAGWGLALLFASMPLWGWLLAETPKFNPEDEKKQIPLTTAAPAKSETAAGSASK